MMKTSCLHVRNFLSHLEQLTKCCNENWGAGILGEYYVGKKCLNLIEKMTGLITCFFIKGCLISQA